MGWRETLEGADSEMNPLPRTTQNTRNHGQTQGPEPEPAGFGGSGGFGFQGKNSNSPHVDRIKEGLGKNGERADPFEPNTPTQYPQNTQNPKPQPSHPLEGLGLLREDWQFIERRARGRHREALLRGYAEHWRAAAAAEPVEFRKANAGRRAANAWLREAGR